MKRTAPDPGPRHQTSVGAAYAAVFEHFEQRLTELEDRVVWIQARLELVQGAPNPTEEHEE